MFYTNAFGKTDVIFEPLTKMPIINTHF